MGLLTFRRVALRFSTRGLRCSRSLRFACVESRFDDQSVPIYRIKIDQAVTTERRDTSQRHVCRQTSLRNPRKKQILTFANFNGVIENVKNTMTLRHLFTMTAGLTDNVDSENLKRGIAETRGTMPTREAMKYLACDPLSFEPGSSWKYSLCHDVLGACTA